VKCRPFVVVDDEGRSRGFDTRDEADAFVLTAAPGSYGLYERHVDGDELWLELYSVHLVPAEVDTGRRGDE
jgi:hypothetical protein